MRREALKLLEDARGACAEVEMFVRGRSEDELRQDVSLQRSVERSMEIVGEALRRLRDLDAAVAEKIPELRRVIGLRNILAHGYDVLDYGIVWSVATEDIPALRGHIEGLMGGEDA